MAAWPGYVDAAFGVAIDVGSTTVAGHLCDLSTGEVVATAGRMNPQIRFGEDLMSRVSYVMMNPGGERELTSAIRTAIDGLIGELVGAADTAVTGCSRSCWSATRSCTTSCSASIPRRSAPPRSSWRRPSRSRGRRCALDLDLPNASFYVGPCIAGHVGADTTAAMLAEGPHRGEAMQLLVDIGTNAEIVLGDRERQFAASSPTGPAFEGAQISCGQRATTGAIERVRIDRQTLEPRFRVIGTDGVVRRAGLRPRRRDLGRLRVGDHRRHRRDVPGRDRRRRRHDPSGSWRRSRHASSPTVARSPTCCASRSTDRRAWPSRRTTSGRSSWPRPRCAPASSCCSSTPGTRT